MKSVKIELPKTINELKIEIFSDLHIGSKKCNQQMIYERIERVKNDPDRYCIILGDLLNNSTKTSVGDCYSEALSPLEQLQTATKMFAPIKDKILGVTSGNHERRSYKTDGIDLMWMFASELGLIERYNYAGCVLFIRFGEQGSHNHNRKQVYSLYMTHGDGNGGRLIGGKANGLQRRGQIIAADIVVAGHTHAPLTFREPYFELDYANSCVHSKEQVFVNASATLGYEEYAELYGMKPSSTVSPIIVLDGRNKKIRVEI